MTTLGIVGAWALLGFHATNVRSAPALLGGVLGDKSSLGEDWSDSIPGLRGLYGVVYGLEAIGAGVFN